MTMAQPDRRHDGGPLVGRPVLERPGLAAMVFVALAPFPVACFTLTLLTDIAYWQTSNLMWQNFSSWLLLAGLVGGVLAMLVGTVDVVLRRRGWGWSYIGVDLLVLVLAFMNSLVHARDGWTSVVPYGLILSALTAFVIVAGGLFWHASSPFRRQLT